MNEKYEGVPRALWAAYDKYVPEWVDRVGEDHTVVHELDDPNLSSTLRNALINALYEEYLLECGAECGE